MHNRLSEINALIIDNNQEVCGLFTTIMSQLGFGSIYSAPSLVEGAQTLRAKKIHLVIVDGHMREVPQTLATVPLTGMVTLSGIDLIRRIRQSRKSPNPFIPVIIFTSPMNKEQLIEARDSGATEIIVKPLSVETLCDRIVRIINDQRLFITADTYKGPCRRVENQSSPVSHERRAREIRIIHHNEYKKVSRYGQ